MWKKTMFTFEEYRNLSLSEISQIRKNERAHNLQEYYNAPPKKDEGKVVVLATFDKVKYHVWDTFNSPEESESAILAFRSAGIPGDWTESVSFQEYFGKEAEHYLWLYGEGPKPSHNGSVF